MNAKAKKQFGWLAALVGVLVLGVSAARADFVPGHERAVGRGIARMIKNIGFETVRPGSVELDLFRKDGVKGFSRITLNLDRGRIDFFGIEARQVECGSVLMTGVSYDGRFQLQILDHSTRTCKDLIGDRWQVRVQEIKNVPTDNIRLLEFGTSIEWMMTTMSTRAQVVGNRFR